MVTKQHFFQGLANLVNLASLASTKCPKTGKCWDSPCSLTFAKQFCKDLPTFAKHFCEDLPDLPSFAKNHFEKIMTRLTKFARVMSKSGKWHQIAIAYFFFKSVKTIIKTVLKNNLFLDD
jgi:hypothetical protein